jgi:hypothetical protein
MLKLLGLGLVGKGMWGRKTICKGTPIDGRYLALGGRDVNFRGTSLFSGQEERKKKIEIGIFFFRISQSGGGNAPSGRFHLGPERLSRSNAPDLFPPDRPSRPVGRLLK